MADDTLIRFTRRPGAFFDLLNRWIIMTFSRIAAAALLSALGFAAHAQDAQGLTRAQVRAELAQAQRTGDIQASGDLGRTLREVSPDRYPAAPASAALTRGDVAAQLQEARRNGELAVGDTGLTQYDIAPQNFPSHAAAQGKTRGQVRAELADAVRTGDIIANNETGERMNELYPERYATSGAKMLASSSAHRLTTLFK
jgi:hypothetical protein